MMLHLTTRHGKSVVWSKVPMLFCLKKRENGKKKKKGKQNQNTSRQTIKIKQTIKTIQPKGINKSVEEQKL